MIRVSWENLEEDSIHEILVFKYKLPLTKVWQRMEAVCLSEEVAYLLDVNPGYPAFHIKRLTYTFEKPVTPSTAELTAIPASNA